MLLLGVGAAVTGSETGQPRFTFGITELFDGVEIIALAPGMFGVAMNSINNTETVDLKYAKIGISDMVLNIAAATALNAMFQQSLVTAHITK